MNNERVFTSPEEALTCAENEFLKFQDLFYTVMADNPELTFGEIDALVEYTHPTFLDEDDQAMYDNAAYLIVLSHSTATF